jgi:hypothetical protein
VKENKEAVLVAAALFEQWWADGGKSSSGTIKEAMRAAFDAGRRSVLGDPTELDSVED